GGRCRESAKGAALVPPAQIWRAAHAGRARGHGVLRMSRAVGMRSEGGELLFEVLLTAGGAVNASGSIADKLLEFVTAVFTQVFKDRHESLHKCQSYFINPGTHLGRRRRKVVDQ